MAPVVEEEHMGFETVVSVGLRWLVFVVVVLGGIAVVVVLGVRVVV